MSNTMTNDTVRSMSFARLMEHVDVSSAERVWEYDGDYFSCVGIKICLEVKDEDGSDDRIMAPSFWIVNDLDLYRELCEQSGWTKWDVRDSVQSNKGSRPPEPFERLMIADSDRM
jgi:hypothetical protein